MICEVSETETLIVPAIIAKTQRELDEMLYRVREKVKRVQLDVMDGEFVPNTSLNFDFKLPSGLEYEAHLMIRKPLDWVKENAYKVDIAAIHVETLDDIGAAVDYVKKMGVKVYLALIPNTKLEIITPYLEKIDGLLILTVEPGSYCVKKEFRQEPLEKIRRLREIDEAVSVEVDGCMNPENARLAKSSGANIFASGSFIFKSENLDEAIRGLEDAVR